MKKSQPLLTDEEIMATIVAAGVGHLKVSDARKAALAIQLAAAKKWNVTIDENTTTIV